MSFLLRDAAALTRRIKSDARYLARELHLMPGQRMNSLRFRELCMRAEDVALVIIGDVDPNMGYIDVAMIEARVMRQTMAAMRRANADVNFG